MLFESTLSWLCSNSHWNPTCDAYLGEGASLGCLVPLGSCRGRPWVTFCHCIEVWETPGPLALPLRVEGAAYCPLEWPSAWAWLLGFSVITDVGRLVGGWCWVGWLTCMSLLTLLWADLLLSVTVGWRMDWKLTITSCCCCEHVGPGAVTAYESSH